MAKISKWKEISLFILIPEVVGVVSGLLTSKGMKQFELLQKPYLTPPRFVFPVVWIILFLLMGIASYFVYKSANKYKTVALVVYGVQLIINFMWSIFFFNKQWHLFAFWWIILLGLLVLVTYWLFYKCDKKAGWLLLPYFIWLVMAAYLNYGIYVLNG
ncbi:MAG: TspO/MBR family protein [Turicibacter sp.]